MDSALVDWLVTLGVLWLAGAGLVGAVMWLRWVSRPCRRREPVSPRGSHYFEGRPER